MLSNAIPKLGYFLLLQALFVLSASLAFFIICHVYVPNINHVHEIHLSLIASEKRGHVYSTDVFSLSDYGSSFFSPGQAYEINLLISIPDSPDNRHVGMSSVRLHLYSLSGNHSTTFSDTVLPVYRPWLIDTMDTLLYAPLYLFNFCKKAQLLRVVFSKNYYDNRNFPTGSGQLVLETKNLHWYSATLNIVAVLNPLVWLIYQSTWLVGAVFVIVVTIALDFLGFCWGIWHYYPSHVVARSDSAHTKDLDELPSVHSLTETEE